MCLIYDQIPVTGKEVATIAITGRQKTASKLAAFDQYHCDNNAVMTTKENEGQQESKPFSLHGVCFARRHIVGSAMKYLSSEFCHRRHSSAHF